MAFMSLAGSRAWYDSGYMVCVSPGGYAVFFLLFYVKENLDPEVVGLLSGVSESR